MCRYSLEDVESRPARQGEKLVTKRLGSHRMMGVVDPQKPDCAVCLTEGTRVILTGSLPQDVPGMPTGIVNSAMTILDANVDYLIFDPDARPVRLDDMDEGIEVTVELLPGESADVTKIDEPAFA